MRALKIVQAGVSVVHTSHGEQTISTGLEAGIRYPQFEVARTEERGHVRAPRNFVHFLYRLIRWLRSGGQVGCWESVL